MVRYITVIPHIVKKLSVNQLTVFHYWIFTVFYYFLSFNLWLNHKLNYKWFNLPLDMILYCRFCFIISGGKKKDMYMVKMMVYAYNSTHSTAVGFSLKSVMNTQKFNISTLFPSICCLWNSVPFEKLIGFADENEKCIVKCWDLNKEA